MNSIPWPTLCEHIRSAQDLASATGKDTYVWFSAKVVWRSTDETLIPKNMTVIVVEPGFRNPSRSRGERR